MPNIARTTPFGHNIIIYLLDSKRVGIFSKIYRQNICTRGMCI